MKRALSSGLLVLAAGLLSLGCGRSAPPEEAPAKVENPVLESELTTVTLSAEAEARLGIETAVVERRIMPATRTIGGEIVTPPGLSFPVTAPVAGSVLAPVGGALPQAGSRVRRGQALLRLVALPPDRDLVRAEEELAVAEARARQAEQEAARMEALARDSLVSRRDLERAQAERDAARAALATARAGSERLRTGTPGPGLSALTIASPEHGVILELHAGAGQVVAAGTPLLTVARLDRLWVRVPLFVGEVPLVDQRAHASVDLLQGDPQTSALPARRVLAPPTADPLSASADLYFELSRSQGLRPGQRVSVTVPLRSGGTSERVLIVPLAAVVYDLHGGTWVYEKIGERTYARRRVEIDRALAEWAILSRGPEPGKLVVRTGVAELFGTEFGPGK